MMRRIVFLLWVGNLKASVVLWSSPFYVPININNTYTEPRAETSVWSRFVFLQSTTRCRFLLKVPQLVFPRLPTITTDGRQRSTACSFSVPRRVAPFIVRRTPRQFPDELRCLFPRLGWFRAGFNNHARGWSTRGESRERVRETHARRGKHQT